MISFHTCEAPLEPSSSRARAEKQGSGGCGGGGVSAMVAALQTRRRGLPNQAVLVWQTVMEETLATRTRALANSMRREWGCTHQLSSSVGRRVCRTHVREALELAPSHFSCSSHRPTEADAVLSCRRLESSEHVSLSTNLRDAGSQRASGRCCACRTDTCTLLGCAARAGGLSNAEARPSPPPSSL